MRNKTRKKEKKKRDAVCDARDLFVRLKRGADETERFYLNGIIREICAYAELLYENAAEETPR
jgi:hypothetical protein